MAYKMDEIERALPSEMEDFSKSMGLSRDIMYKFKECHDLCVKSGLFSPQVTLELDSCAVGFRQMCVKTVTIAEVLSYQWVDSTIKFYQNVCTGSRTNAETSVVLLGKQAKEISKMFKIIAVWARDLSGKFYGVQDDIIDEADKFTERCEEAVEEAESAKLYRARQREIAADLRREAQNTEGNWNIAQAALFWNPLGAIITGIGGAVASSKTDEAKRLEDEATEKLRAAERNLAAKQSDEERAKYVASKAETLVGFLDDLEGVCNAIAAFWTKKSDKFTSQGGRMSTNEKAIIKYMPEKMIHQNVTYWVKTKDQLDYYARAMTIVSKSCTFKTDANPPRMKYIHLPTLDFILYVPSAIDIQNIK